MLNSNLDGLMQSARADIFTNYHFGIYEKGQSIEAAPRYMVTVQRYGRTPRLHMSDTNSRHISDGKNEIKRAINDEIKQGNIAYVSDIVRVGNKLTIGRTI